MGKTDDLRSGALRVLVLSELALGENYGWGIAEAIRAKSGEDLTVRVETLYPILHSLENAGAVSSRWAEGENGRPRKLYKITAKGKKLLEREAAAFRKWTGAAMQVLNLSMEKRG